LEELKRLKRGGCYEREKQRGKGKQEGAAEKPQREEKGEEREERPLGTYLSSLNSLQMAESFIRNLGEGFGVPSLFQISHFKFQIE
jgi:hypothetical protein